MSMSSTQARLLLNTEQLANCEFEGQQINQARSVLSAKSAAEQTSMLSLEVPTPPATTDYQTVKYTGSLGATKYAFDASSVKPNGDSYTITMQEQKYGDSLQKNVQVATVERNQEGSFKGVELPSTKVINKEVPTSNFKADPTGTQYMIPIELVEETDLAGNKTYKFPETGGQFYTQEGDNFNLVVGAPEAGKKYFMVSTKNNSENTGVTVSRIMRTDKDKEASEKGALVSEKQLDDIYILGENGQIRKVRINDEDIQIMGDGTYRLRTDRKYVTSSTDPSAKGYSMQGDVKGITVGGHGVHELIEAEKQEYGDALANCGLKNSDGEPYTADDFYMYYDDKGSAVFVLKNDITDGNNNATTYSYVANGEYTKNQEYDNAQLIFDPSNGRITEVQIPNYDEVGNIVSWSSITVTAETVIDNAAYDDACAQYQYDSMIYEQKLQECQKKIDDIQREDKNLELQLQRLDTKRQQLTTEKEALEKVLQDSVEGSYKTFSG